MNEIFAVLFFDNNGNNPEVDDTAFFKGEQAVNYAYDVIKTKPILIDLAKYWEINDNDYEQWVKDMLMYDGEIEEVVQIIRLKVI